MAGDTHTATDHGVIPLVHQEDTREGQSGSFVRRDSAGADR